ncbi:MAG: HEAT repeat domain-containing protein, partial [Burkholderiales bacterium]
YPSAAALALDLARFLADEPVRARPLSRWSRLGRRAWRRRRLLSGARAGCLALGGAAAGLRWQAEREAHRQALAELTRALASDPEAIVRARAAIALGAVGDERALPALESALAREHSFSVRTQAITAIGQIGGVQATAVLGRILLDSTANRTERVIAAQALWRQDSAAARQYLSAGAQDADAQVRRASSAAPRLGTRPATTERQGPASVR